VLDLKWLLSFGLDVLALGVWLYGFACKVSALGGVDILPLAVTFVA
jgi:hypothetical protein